jgi:hypothetical protein
MREAFMHYEERFGKEVSRRRPDFKQIINAAYFTRVWVAQEMFLGKSVTCQLGRQLFSVDTLMASLEIWTYRDGAAEKEEICARCFEPSLSGRWDALQNATKTRDFSIVRGFGARQCSDPRDHIYGLSALFENPSEYPIEYSLSITEVFCNFTVHCCETLSSLSVLWLYRGITRSSDMSSPISSIDDDSALPSWYPSWVMREFHVA